MTTPARILLADDSMVVRAVVRGQLVGEGLVLIEAADGDEAIERVRSDAPDVVLLDVEMPGRNGYEVLEAIQADPDLAHIPVIFLSGRVTADDVARGLRLGAHDYLRKPVEPGELIARLTAALRTKELHDRLRRDNAHLREIAPVDSLTGALDVRGLQQAVRDLAAASRNNGAPLGGVLLDVDGLAAVNDRHGWDGGDAVLKEIANRITAELAADHVIGRCGPDEFLVLLPGTDASAAAEFADALRSTVTTAPHRLGDELRPVDVSVGAAAVVDGDAAVLLATLQQAIVDDKRRRGVPTLVASAPPTAPAVGPTPIVAEAPVVDPTPVVAEEPCAVEESSADPEVDHAKPFDPQALMASLRSASSS